MKGTKVSTDRPGLSILQVACLQIVMIGVLGGILANFTWGMYTLGPLLLWAWLIGGLLQINVTRSLIQVSTDTGRIGSCYAWLRALNRTRTAMFVGYILLVAYIASVADVDRAFAGSFLSFLGINAPSGPLVSAIALGCLVPQTMLATLQVRAFSRTNTVVATAMVGTILAAIALLVIVGLRQPASTLFHNTGIAFHPRMPKFLLMLMIPAWVLATLDAGFNFSEDTRDSRRVVPRAVALGTVLSFVLGAILILTTILALSNADNWTTASIPHILTARIGDGFSRIVTVVELLTLFFQPVVALMVAGRLLRVGLREGPWPAGERLLGAEGRGFLTRTTILGALTAGILVAGWSIWYGLGSVWPALFPLAYGITIGVHGLTHASGRLAWPTTWTLPRVMAMLAAGWCAFLVVLLPLFDAVHAIPVLVFIVAIIIPARRLSFGSAVKRVA